MEFHSGNAYIVFEKEIEHIKNAISSIIKPTLGYSSNAIKRRLVQQITEDCLGPYVTTLRKRFDNNKKILTLYDGKSINVINGKISEFEFSKIDYNISKFNSNTTTYQKTQETKTINLIKCSLFFNGSIINSTNIEIENIKNCRLDNLENVYKELYSRLVKPLYITFLISISLLFILKSKSSHSSYSHSSLEDLVIP